MNPIAAKAQNPAPKPDRQIAPAPAAATAPQQTPGRESSFGTVLRTVSGASSPSGSTEAAAVRRESDAEDPAPAETGPKETGTEETGPKATGSKATGLKETGLKETDPKETPPKETGSAEAAVAAAGPASAPADAAAAMLASLMRIVLPPAAGASPGMPAAGQSDLTRLAGAAASSTVPADPATTLANGSPSASAKPLSGDAAAEVARTDAAAARTDAATVLRAVTGLGVTAVTVEVLGRAVHFKPVATGASALAGATPSPIASTGSESGTAKPQIAHPDLPAMAAAMALQIQSETESRRTLAATHATAAVDATAAADAAATADAETPRLVAPGEGRVVTEVETMRLAPVSGPARDIATPAESRDELAASPAGSPPTGSLPTGSLPSIASAIRQEIERATAAGAASRIQADPAADAIADGPLRTLKIQLRPDDLGIVTVEMRLANGQLETRLRASRPETAALLSRDAAILTDLLNQSNTYRAEVMIGPARPADAAAAPGGSSAQAPASFTDGGARPGGGGDRQRQAEPRHTASRHEGDRTDEAVRPRDSGIYL